MRIALCLAGKVGNIKGKSGSYESDLQVLDVSYKYMIQNLFNINTGVDVFLHSWDGELEHQLIKYFQPKSSLFEKQKKFDIPSYVCGTEQRKQNHYSKWYSIEQVMNLKSQYENQNNIKYDFIFLSRYDVSYLIPINFNILDKNKFYVGLWNKQFLNKKEINNKTYYNVIDKIDQSQIVEKNVGFPYDNQGFIDFWFISNSTNMDKFSKLYQKLDLYNQKKHCPLDHAGNISNHRLAKYHLEQLKLLDNVAFYMKLHNDFPLTRRWWFKCGN